MGNHSSARRLVQRILVGHPFWDLWGGRIFATVIMAAMVSLPMHYLKRGVSEFIDTTVQNTLMSNMLDGTTKVPACDHQKMLDCISVIGIDNQDFRETFGQQSPLNPDLLRGLFDALAKHPPKAVAIDLDLSPASELEHAARGRLFDSLQALAKVSHVVMVCPQGFSTEEPGPLDKEWVARFGTEVQFASPGLSEDGLYYQHNRALEPLGVVAKRLAVGEAPVAHDINWLEACTPREGGAAPGEHAGQQEDSTQHEGGDEEAQPLLIRPSHAMARTFAEAMQAPAAFAGQLVFVGGKWGINDQFHLRGQSEPVYGVTLHAWVAASELNELHHMDTATALVFELGVGLLSGFLFSWIWSGIAETHKDKHFSQYGWRSVLYLLFLLLTVSVPVAWILLSAHLAKFGIVFGAAGMFLSASADSVISAHEKHLSNEKEAELPHPARRFLVATMLFGSSFATLLHFGASVPLCAACGAAVGLATGWWDRGEEPGEAKKREDSAFDMVARFLWLLAKATALTLAVAHEFDSPSRVMVACFLLAWCAVYCWPGTSAHKHALARHKG